MLCPTSIVCAPQGVDLFLTNMHRPRARCIVYAGSMDLRGKTVLLTGASSGIGLALARALSRRGCRIYALDRKPFPEEIPEVTALTADITRGGELRSALAAVEPPIDVVINNAGVMRRGTLFESSEEDFDLLFGVNVKGSWLVLREALPLLAARPVIVQMSSRHALRPPSDPALYALTKQTLMHFAENLARDWPAFTVKTLFPGPVDTPLARHGLEGTALAQKEKLLHPPEELAEQIVALIESEAHTQLLYEEKTGKHVLA